MDNNRSLPETYYNYGEYNEYQNYRQTSSSRNEPKESLLKSTAENKSYYRSQDNFQDSYSEDQLWNMQARRAPNSSYSMFSSSHKQNMNQSVGDPQIRNNLSQKRDLPLKGILVGGHNGNNTEGTHRSMISEHGMAQEKKDNNQHTAKSHTNYRLPSYISNENLMAPLCGGEPMLDMEDSQYYLVNDGKNGQENYDNNKNLYDDFNVPSENEILFKENMYDYNCMDSEVYDTSLRDVAPFDPRNRASTPFQKQISGNNQFEKPEGSAYQTNDSGYYMYQQRNPPSSSQVYNQSRQQNVNMSRNLIHAPVSRQEMYKQLVSEKLNETFHELKNAGLNDKNGECKPLRNENLMGLERFKYPEFLNENSKRLPNLPQINKYKTGNDNEAVSRRSYFPMNKTTDASCNTNMTIPRSSEEQKFKNSSVGESGSFIHKHKEYQNSPSVAGCCVDVYNNYRKEKIPDRMLRIE